MSSEELKPCPFCGSPAKSDNGFSPAESITYAWCSNTECQLHSVDVGMTPSDWNRRALPNVDPQPPTVSVTWHESPESVHRAMWEEVAVAEGMTYEQLIAESEGEGETETGETVAFTHEQELAGMRGQGCWAFVDTRNNTIHAWADEATPRELVLHMLAHEIGHITGEPHPDDMQEEMRAEQFGRVAKMAYGLLPARAQLAAIQGGTGEVVEVVAYLLPDYVISRRLSTHSEMKIGKPLMTVAQHERIVAALSAQLRDANNLADQWAEKNAALSSWQRTQSAPVSKAERLPLESLEPLHRPVPSGWAVKRPAIDARYVDNYLGPLEGWLEDPRRAVLFGNREAAIAAQAALSVDSLLPIFVVWLVYDPVFDTYREQAQ